MARPTDTHTKSGPAPLSDSIIKAAEAPAKGKRFLFDAHRDAPKGFGLRIMASGSKAFVLRYLVDGKDRITTIGAYPTWSLKAARERAKELRHQVDDGTDPLQAERDRKTAEAAAAIEAEREQRIREQFTLRALCGAYVGHLKASGKASHRDAASAFKVHLLDVPTLAHLADMPARDIGPEHIALIVRRVMELGKARTAGVLRSYLNAAFTAARKAPYDTRLPAALIPFAVTSNPVEVIAAIPVKAGTRALSADELRAYIGALGNDLADTALRLALFAGGQRMAQLLRCTVRDFDPQAETLLLLDGKGRRREPRAHLLPLAPMAAGIVKALAEAAPEGAATLFASRGGTLHPDTLSKRVVAISAELGGEPFDMRAIRRTVETQMAALAISKDLRAHLLSHGLTGVQATHYDKHDYIKEKRAALVQWESHLTRLIDGTSANVVPFAREA